MNNFRDKSRGLTGLHTALEGLLSTIEQIPVSGGGGSATDANFIDWVGRVAINTLTTTAKTVKGAINELKNGVDDALSNTENLDSALGDTTSLVTSDKSNVVAAINEVGKDYIETSGTTSGWRWEKWHSGKAIAWTADTVNVAISTAQGSLFYGDAINISLPFTFKAVHVINANLSGNSTTNAWMSIINLSTTKYGVRMWRATSAAAADYKYSVIVQGTWK